jgi:AcrR family transcriptional regulator
MTARARRAISGPTRRSSARTTDTGARILSAARDLFIREGWAAFSTRRVATEAGVSLGSLQHFFPSRERLLAGMLEQITSDYGRMYAEVDAALPLKGKERLLAAIDLLVADVWRPDTRKLFMNLYALSCYNGFAAKLMNEVYAHHRRRIATYIGAARSSLSEQECLDLGLQVAALIDGLMIYTAPDARSVSPRGHLAEMVKATVLRLIA